MPTTSSLLFLAHGKMPRTSPLQHRATDDDASVVLIDFDTLNIGECYAIPYGLPGSSVNSSASTSYSKS